MPSTSDIIVYGEPMHMDEKTLVAQYRRDSLEDFLAKEARYSIGNYVIVDKSANFCRIVAAPGYCGGYTYIKDNYVAAATHLSTVLAAQNDKIEMDPFGVCFFLNYAPKSSFQQLPFTTVFKNVGRIPPASVAEFERGDLISHYSYILATSALPPPASFEAAMDEVSEAMARHYKTSDAFPSVMFSGGADSLIIYLALREKMDQKDIRVFTMHHSQHSITNGPLRALPIGEKLNFEVEFLEGDYLESDSVSEFTRDMMTKDFPNGRGPHIAFVDHRIPKSDILHGQNMDTIININMLVTHANLERGYLSKSAVLSDMTPAQELVQYRAFLGNLQFTHNYIEDKEFQKHSVSFYKSLGKNTLPDPDPGGEGVFRGMIACQQPNLITPDRYPFDQIEALNREAATFKRFVGEEGVKPKYVIDLLRHYTWSHLANKRISSFELPGGSRTYPPAMAAPVSSYYIGRRRTAAMASQPKKELYDLIQKKSKGVSYTDLFSGRTEPDKWKKQNSNDDPLIKHNMDRINADNSAVLNAISEQPIRDHVEEIYRTVEKSCQPGDDGFTKFNQSRARQLLNLELLISEATKNA